MDEKELKEKFEEIYNKKIMTKLAPLERERISEAETFKVCITCAIIFFIAVLVMGLFVKFLENGPALIFTLTGCFVLSIVFMFIAGNIQKKFRNRIKSQLLTDLLFLFGNFNIYRNEIISLKEIKNTGLFPNANIKNDDDRIGGTYKGINVFLFETELSQQDESNDINRRKYSNSVQVFKGLILRTVMNKKYNGRTIIKQRALNTTGQNEFKAPQDLEEVILEDSEFNKSYAVFSNDQVEARYLITPTFMERLKKIRNVFGAYEIHCVFEDNYITLFLETGRDFFEVGDINTTLCNKKNYEKIFRELVSIFNLIHYFKLDKKLGL